MKPSTSSQRVRMAWAIIRFAQRHRRIATSVLYALITVAAYASAFLLRFEFRIPEPMLRVFGWSVVLLVGIRLFATQYFRLGQGRWRFVGVQDILRLTVGVSAGSALFAAITWLTPGITPVPRSVILIDWVLTIYVTAAVWLAYRLFFERLTATHSDGEGKRVVIVGAGVAGQMLAAEMRRYSTGFIPVAFVDDDPFKRGTLTHGVEVLGSTEEIPEIAQQAGADEIFIAIPSTSPKTLRRIVERCEDSNLPFKHLPGIEEVMTGDAHVDQLREVKIEDLLGRAPVTLELPELAEDLSGRTVMISGAAGSIGSELARQVALHGPEVLVLLDNAETPLYFVHLELRDKYPAIEVVAELSDVADPTAIERVLEQHRPDRVFHAAAYKHVPMLESNVRSGVRTNVLGTWTMAQAAGKHSVARFVLVSTDKAVQPANVMGATKQVAELIVLRAQELFPDTSYGVVRFGNVLGSNGSVIPLFRRQLAQGLPLTVTHEDVTRYFMTISEAVQLILQASLLGELRGAVAMLEMGEPIRITELAKNLLRLSGRAYRPGVNVTFTGLRNGEKLHEELTAPWEVTRPTRVPRVHLVETNGRSSELSEALENAIAMGDLDALTAEFRRAPLTNGAGGGDDALAVIRSVEPPTTTDFASADTLADASSLASGRESPRST